MTFNCCITLYIIIIIISDIKIAYIFLFYIAMYNIVMS